MDVVAIHGNSKPDETALVEDERTLTWAQFAERRNRLAHGLQGLGVEAGQRVVMWAPNSIEYLLGTAAVGAIGGVSVPMNHRLTAAEAAYVLEDSDAVAVFVGDPYLPVADEVRQGGTAPGVRHWILTGDERRPWAEHLADLVAAGGPEPIVLEGAAAGGLGGSMAYTAGTTGKPKGALRTGIDPAVALGWLNAMDLADPTHIHLVAGPLYHSAPGAFAYLTQVMGGACVIMRKFDAEAALRLIETHRCSSTFMAPILLKRILALPKDVRARYDVSSMRSLVVGGAPCPNPVKEEALAYFGPVLYEFYGSSELGINTVLAPADMLRKPGSCGRPTTGVEIAIFDDDGQPLPPGEPGALYVRRYGGMFDHYHKKPDATAEATKGEWVSVGDVAYLDEEGFVFICDRQRDMVISGGVNIYPAEVEDVLHRHPAVADVAVFGVPDEEWGERVHAAVLLQPGEALTPAELTAFAREHMADYKVPRDVTFHDDFPRDSAGKLVKRLLRDPYWEGRATKVV
jgi:acyl-CoA synthetase (AMP-forming)/AMP-acid ligase II